MECSFQTTDPFVISDLRFGLIDADYGEELSEFIATVYYKGKVVVHHSSYDETGWDFKIVEPEVKKPTETSEPINFEEMLVEKDGVYCTKDTNEPYSGQVFSLHKNGQKSAKRALLEVFAHFWARNLG